ncbi:MAG: hypothetical protein SGILL_005748 [Bacillariaceae sp.]
METPPGGAEMPLSIRKKMMGTSVRSMVEMLVSHRNELFFVLNCTDKDGNTVLHLAAANRRITDEGKVEIIQRLRHFGADGNVLNNLGKTPLDILETSDAATRELVAEILNGKTSRDESEQESVEDQSVRDVSIDESPELLSNGAGGSVPMQQGRLRPLPDWVSSPLPASKRMAKLVKGEMSNGSFHSMTNLLSKGLVKVDAVDANGNTPLHLVASNSNITDQELVQMMHWLKELGADENALNNDGKSSLDMVRSTPVGKPKRRIGKAIPRLNQKRTSTEIKGREDNYSLATKQGLCLKCNKVKVNQKGRFGIGKIPITNAEVHEGTCIGCYGDRVPQQVWQDWLARAETSAPAEQSFEHLPPHVVAANEAFTLGSDETIQLPVSLKVSDESFGGLDSTVMPDMSPLDDAIQKRDDKRVGVLPNNTTHGDVSLNHNRIAKAIPLDKEGICLSCGVNVAEVDPFDGTGKLLTNDEVYKGICRKCNPMWVPATDVSTAATIQHTLTTQSGHRDNDVPPQKIKAVKWCDDGATDVPQRTIGSSVYWPLGQDGDISAQTLERTSVSAKPAVAPEDSFQQTHHVTNQDRRLGHLLETIEHDPETMATALQTIAGYEEEIHSIIASKQEADADQLELCRILTNPVARDFYLSFCSMLSSKVITCQALYTDNIKHKVGPLSRENICDAVSNCAAKRAIKSMATLNEKFPDDYTVLESIKSNLQSIAEASGNTAFNMEMLGETIKDASLAIQLPGTYAAAAVLFKLVGLPSEIKRRKQIAYVVLFAAIAEKDDGLENVLKQVARRVLRLVEIADVLPYKPIKGIKKLQRKLSGSIVDTAAKEFGQNLAEQIFKYIAKPKKTEQLWDILDNCNTETKLWDALVCEAFQVSPDILNRRYGNESMDEPPPKTNPPNDSAAAATNQSSGAAFVDTDGQMNANSGATVADADGRMQRIERAMENLTAAVERTTGHEVDLGRQVLLRRCPEEEYQYRLERLEALVGGLCEQVQALTTAQEVSREDVESELRHVQEEVQSLRR